MGKLTNLKPQVASLPLSIGFARDRDEHGHSKTAEPWRRWYKLARWKRLRTEVFERDHFQCQMAGCGRIKGNTSQLVADHKRPHRGDYVLFWAMTNLQTLCKPCHDRLKQVEERRRPAG